MEFWPLEITMISAMDLEAVDVYVVVSLSGDKSKRKQRTPVLHKDGSTNPWLGHTFGFNIDDAAARDGCLKFKIMAKRSFCCVKNVGEVDVQVRELLEKGGAGDGKPKVLSYRVRLPTGKTKGALQFSYKFGERFTLAVPPPVKADETVTGYTAATVPPASSSAAAYPPPMHGAAPPLSGYLQGTILPEAYPPGAYPPAGYLPVAYPPQGYMYPRAGYGYTAPPPAYQTPSGGGNFLQRLVGEVLGNMIANELESFNDAGFDASF